MAAQTLLPPKVIKHWFRNTLFKERQKNKDSPYNFNNPPSTILNLEEYEKTGVSEVIHLNKEEQREYQPDNSTPKEHIKTEEKANLEGRGRRGYSCERNGAHLRSSNPLVIQKCFQLSCGHTVCAGKAYLSWAC